MTKSSEIISISECRDRQVKSAMRRACRGDLSSEFQGRLNKLLRPGTGNELADTLAQTERRNAAPSQKTLEDLFVERVRKNGGMEEMASMVARQLIAFYRSQMEAEEDGVI